ncbi:hypothetical protein ACFX13_012903 [Malus domestica]|nr:transcriptional regulator SUPERMAN-like [Malus domestica]XP_050118005.1 transcriptional regulator SUPERMAN-like [Malus sylvestris]ADU55566.1 transcriptional regulator superman [Malus domestica]
MEKKGLVSNSLKDHAGIVTRAIRRSKTTYEEDDYNFDGFAWPPRSYTCSFCKREFRSAQALGGHMNVHRKDRARLKGSPPRDSQYTSTILNLNLNKVPNPNPNFSSTSSASSPSSPSSWISPISSTLPSLISPPAPPPVFLVPSSENMKWVVGDTLFNHPLNFKASDFGTTVKKNAESFCGVGDRQCDGFIGEEHGCIKTVKAADHPHHPIVRLDLEIGMLGDSNKEDLDLELRLGYS